MFEWYGAKQSALARLLKNRLLLAMWLVSFALFSLLGRLYTLQVVRGEELSTRGRRNFVQQLRIPYDRGIIFDRYGRILVDNRSSLDVQITPAFMGKNEQALVVLQRLAMLLHLKEEEHTKIIEQISSKKGLDRFVALPIKRDLDAQQVDSIEAAKSLFLLDGVDIVEGRKRMYRYGSLAAHLLGYVNEIDAAALELERARGNPGRYDLGDMVGREGIERTYERYLRGVDGAEKVVVDAKGRRQFGRYVDRLLGEHRRVEPIAGQNVYLTIDVELQHWAEQIFARKGQAGSIVAMDPHTGEILAFVSFPTYEPNLISGSLAKEEKKRLDADPLKPWMNRSIQGQYAPGSVFKVVTALAALKQQESHASEKVHCPGFFKMGRHTWRCWKDSGHGFMDLHQAMKSSCDTYFYQMASRLGLDAIAQMAEQLSFGQRTGIELRGEKPGLIPNESYHQKIDAATGGYQKGMAINTSIGQGSVLVTPLQMALAYSAIANGKWLLRPQVVHHIETADKRLEVSEMLEDHALPVGAVDHQGSPIRLLSQHWQQDKYVVSQRTGQGPKLIKGYEIDFKELDIDDTSMKLIRDALAAATGEPGGTGYRMRSKLVSMAGKTGTAQVIRLGKERLKDWQVDYKDRDHAWFVGYAPAEAPRLVVAVINEHAGHGGSAAAPLAVAVIDKFFELQHLRQAQSYAKTSQRQEISAMEQQTTTPFSQDALR